MDIHEYQAKVLLADFGMPIARGGIAYSPEQAAYRAMELGGEKWVVKAQIHSGARGKAGGIKVCATENEVMDAANELLGRRLVTNQTGPQGNSSERIMCVASSAGGMDIEEIVETDPDAIVRVPIEPAVGMQDFQAREIAFALGMDSAQIAEAVKALKACYRAFRDLDATMVEVNPLVVTTDGRIIALDAKMGFDDNALFRRPQISELRDKSQEDAREMNAADRGLSYVGLDGNIGCIINGAGLAMATMDMIKHVGGEPANFLDIGGGASPDRVAKAFNLVLSDEGVDAILVNIFAGINRCDWVAEGVIQAMHKLDVPVPVVVRLSGTNVELGRQILADSDIDLITADTLAEAAEKAVAAAQFHQSASADVKEGGK
jgi:malate-CoA ligase subunit beta